MGFRELSELSERARLVVGAFALSDSHTLTASQVAEMSRGVIATDAAVAALAELADAGLAEEKANGAYQLSREGISFTLQMQSALARKAGHGDA